jgi:hypothetical protein
MPQVRFEPTIPVFVRAKSVLRMYAILIQISNLASVEAQSKGVPHFLNNLFETIFTGHKFVPMKLIETQSRYCLGIFIIALSLHRVHKSDIRICGCSCLSVCLHVPSLGLVGEF